MGPQSTGGVAVMVLRSFIPPIILITMVLGSILFGLATPTEAAGVGAFGAILLALVNLVVLPALGVPDMNFEGQAEIDMGDKVEGQGFGDRLVGFWSVLKQVVYRAALTNGMLFGIFIGATLFSFVFRSLGGDDIVIEWSRALAWGHGACCSC
jgi:TRAP-type mannitol/chloroaromatic compound transport system permease large subunit